MCSGQAPRPHLGPISAPKRTPRHLKIKEIVLDVLKVWVICAFWLASPLELDFGHSQGPFWEPFFMIVSSKTVPESEKAIL